MSHILVYSQIGVKHAQSVILLYEKALDFLLYAALYQAAALKHLNSLINS